MKIDNYRETDKIKMPNQFTHFHQPLVISISLSIAFDLKFDGEYKKENNK